MDRSKDIHTPGNSERPSSSSQNGHGHTGSTGESNTKSSFESDSKNTYVSCNFNFSHLTCYLYLVQTGHLVALKEILLSVASRNLIATDGTPWAVKATSSRYKQTRLWLRRNISAGWRGHPVQFCRYYATHPFACMVYRHLSIFYPDYLCPSVPKLPPDPVCIDFSELSVVPKLNN